MVDGENKRVTEGDPAPEFALPNDQGEIVRLSDFAGRTVVLFMYPKDHTPGCTREVCDFRDRFERIQAAGAVVLGISPDSVASHQKFKAKHALPYALLSDVEAEAIRAYGAWVEKSLFGHKYWGVERSTFIIGPDGILRKVFRKVKVKGHVDEVISALEHLDWM